MLTRPHPSAYRAASAVMAAAYVAVGYSVEFRTPRPLSGSRTVFDTVASSEWWAAAFVLVATGLFLTAALVPRRLPDAHIAALVLVAGFGVANLGVSLLNGSGWQVAALCLALFAAHGMCIARRELAA